jgi:hypothetical protein
MSLAIGIFLLAGAFVVSAILEFLRWQGLGIG